MAHTTRRQGPNNGLENPPVYQPHNHIYLTGSHKPRGGPKITRPSLVPDLPFTRSLASYLEVGELFLIKKGSQV